MAKQRSRRQRKKLHVGEFQELGFLFNATLHDGSNDEALIDAFLAETMAPNDLSFGGWATGGAIQKIGRGSVTEEARQAVLNWLGARSEIAKLSATGLIDMWYSTDGARSYAAVKG